MKVCPRGMAAWRLRRHTTLRLLGIIVLLATWGLVAAASAPPRLASTSGTFASSVKPLVSYSLKRPPLFRQACGAMVMPQEAFACHKDFHKIYYARFHMPAHDRSGALRPAEGEG